MSVNVGEVATFPYPSADKEQVLKILEESAEVYSAWEFWKSTDDPELVPPIVDECADLITATCNLLAALGVDDMRDAMRACEERNRARGRL